MDENLQMVNESLQTNRVRLRKIRNGSTPIQPTKLEIEEATMLLDLITAVAIVDSSTFGLTSVNINNSTSVKVAETDSTVAKGDPQSTTTITPSQNLPQKAQVKTADKRDSNKEPQESVKSTEDNGADDENCDSVVSPPPENQSTSAKVKPSAADAKIPITVLQSKIVCNENERTFIDALIKEIEAHAAEKEEKFYKKIHFDKK